MLVRGRVQGVGYRWSLRAVAERADLAGWVRNRVDGSVEAEIEGTPHQVEQMLGWMADGPPGARVDEREVAEIEPRGSIGFDVRGDA